VDFVAVDMPNANKLTVGIMALVAQQEREATSACTKAALVAAKASTARVAKTDLFASRVGPLVHELRRSGMVIEAIARELAVYGVRTARGGAWTAQGIKNVLAREALKT